MSTKRSRSSSGSPLPDGATAASLARVLGVPGAVLMGLGSIVGTGIFVTIGTAAGIAGSAVLVAIGLAAIVATCNGLASAQLAAAHPVSGGAYEYAYRYASPWLGRLAGITFVCAKTASAATAALGFAGYALTLGGQAASTARADHRWLQIAIAGCVIAVLAAIVAGGMKRSHRMNTIIVTTTLVALAVYVIATLPHVSLAHLSIAGLHPDALRAGDLAHATALVFVAYTGYGRIATLGEEVRDPARTIPRAMVITLAITAVLYIVVTATAVGAAGAPALAEATRTTSAPLEATAPEALRPFIAIGAATAMLGVILNLLLGVSRVVLAMARRTDLPSGLARVEGSSPRRAVIVTGVAMLGLALIGSVQTTWTVSAFTVLIYYSVMNICALRQPAAERRFPRIVPAAGLAMCASLAVWIAVRTL
jgi:basic amino acid/polyamine antiporter, APA family